MRYNTYEEIMASDVVEPLSIDNNQSLEYAKDYAVNMAFRIITTQVFTQYSLHFEKRISKALKEQIEDLLDKQMPNLKLALLDYLTYGKCILYGLQRISPKGAIIRSNNSKYYIEYEGQVNADKWWKDDPKTVKVIIAPKEIHNMIMEDMKGEDIVLHDDTQLSVFTNPLPVEDTLKQILENKTKLVFNLMPLMAERSLIPCLLGKADSAEGLRILKKALANWYNNTRVLVPNKAEIEVISMGKDINVQLLELMLYTYDSATFMALGSSISTVKASGQELTTSRTIDRNLLRIITGYQQEVERWIYEQLKKMGFDGVWIKFETPDAGDKETELERVKTAAELKQLEHTIGEDLTEYINRIFPTNEYGIEASIIDLTEQEVEKILKKSKPLGELKDITGTKEIYYIDDEEKLKQLELNKRKLEKVIDYLEKKADKFAKQSIGQFKELILNMNGHLDDSSFNTFVQEQVEDFILNYLAPALNNQNIYDYIDGGDLQQLKEYWTMQFGNIYRSYSQQFIDTLQEGVQKGLGEEALAKELKKVADDIKGQRLQQRARQEINKTYNYGRAKKFWNDRVVYVTMEDERVRPSHKKLHGLVFVPAEHPELVPPLGYNCRCTITPYRGE